MLESNMLGIFVLLVVHILYLMRTEEEGGHKLYGNQKNKKMADQWRDLF